MVQNKALHTLADIVPKGLFVGTSLILYRDGRFLYGIRSPKRERTRQVLELTGIGGSLEQEDATWTAGAVREAREEIDCKVQLLPCRQTLIVRDQTHIERIALQGQELPAAVIFRHHRTPPHQPWHANHQGKSCLIVSLAECIGNPRPAMELPALIWLPPEHIVETAQRDVPLSQLLGTGAELVEDQSRPLPPDAWARMTDSQEALALALGENALAFYLSIAEGNV